MASEVPEADAQEQARAVADDALEPHVADQVARKLARDPELPVDDALEQSEAVPTDEEDYGS